ncbi:MAG: hypothetical protein LBI42_02220 [Chitinispirillales bacterium]|jgi:hypothetical protein|nr:hypothetical protein [Chitinispirillales bacterium]
MIFLAVIIAAAAFSANAAPAANAQSIAADSLEWEIRNDYLVCTGDTTTLTRKQLFQWKKEMDSLISDKGYAEKFASFVRVTGLKAQHVRPCEPIIFFERIDKQLMEMDSIVEAQRRKKSKAYNDSMTIANELKNLKSNPADIMGIPAGISKSALLLIFDRDSVKAENTPEFLRVDSVEFDSLILTVALYFDENGKYNRYETETKALNAAELDKTVRKWADQLSDAYEKRVGPPGRKNRIGFHDIKQGRLSISRQWSNTNPKVLVGLATHNNLYYAKAMVSY